MNSFGKPITAGPRDYVAGYTEWGAPIYQTPQGQQYYSGLLDDPKPQHPAMDERGNLDGNAPWREDIGTPVNALKQVAQAILGGIWQGVEAPANALRGDQQTLADAWATALDWGLLGAGNALAGAAPRSVKSLERSAHKSYNFPTKSEVGDALGRSHTGGLDVEGRPLVARYVVGGSPERTVEQSLSPEALAEIIQGQTGRGIAFVAPSEMPRGASGRLLINRLTGKPEGVEIARGLPDEVTSGVAAHEVGHLLDEVAGQIPTDGLSRELKPLYNYGLEGRDRTAKFTEPKHLGYIAQDIPREYIAEAIRQYMVAPDAMKARAPNTAARIRKYINEHPELSRVIQFNTLAGLSFYGGDALLPQQEPGYDTGVIELQRYLEGL